MRLGHAIYTRTRRGKILHPESTLSFYDVDTFWKWALKYAKNPGVLYFVSHNLNFDLPILHAFHELVYGGYTLDSFYTKGTVGIYRWHKDKSKIIALDNGNFFQGTLEYLSSLVNLPKLDIDFEADNDSSTLEYCIRDTQIIHRLWVQWLGFLDIHNCGSFKITTSSTAFNTYRHRFMEEKIYIHDNEKALQLERKTYSGGRVECFYKGLLAGDTYYSVDINSMYPFVMSTNEYPIGLLDYTEVTSIGEIERKLKNNCVIADVTINITEPYFTHKVNGFTAYPIGYFRAQLTTNELKLCIKRGWIISVHSAAFYRKGNIFRDYVDYFYSLRQRYKHEGNVIYDTICKLFLNSVYGKFGQKGLQTENWGYDNRNVYHIEYVGASHTQSAYQIVQIMGQTFGVFSEGESYNSSPAIAAHVTANARLYLKALIDKVPLGHYFYCDTDSIKVDSIGLKALSDDMHEIELGKLKVEHTNSWLCINGPKDYITDTNIIIKGIRSNAKIVSPNSVTQERWPKLRTMIKNNSMRDYTVSIIEKHLYRNTTSGGLTVSGWIVPYALLPPFRAPV